MTNIPDGNATKNDWSDTFRSAIDRTGTKTFAMFISAYLMIAGNVMIYRGLKDGGLINIKVALVDGQLKTGSAGVVLILLSTIIVLLCVIMRSRSSTLEIHPDHIKWTGVPNHIDHATIRELAKEMKLG